MLVSAGQADDAPIFAICWRTCASSPVGPGRDQARARARDKAYQSSDPGELRGAGSWRSSRTVRSERHRKRRGSRGGRPPAFDVDDYKSRNVIERGFDLVKQWRGLATRYDKLAINYRAGAVLAP